MRPWFGTLIVLALAIDCSARFCAVALYRGDGDRVLAQSSPDIGRGHAEQLPGVLDAVLKQAGAGLSGVERLGVTIGPGSFAGIRVGVAFARGLALAMNVPAIGVGTLEALAVPAALASRRPVMAVFDARRDRVWAILAGADGAVMSPAAEMSPQAAAGLAAQSDCAIIGSGAHLLADHDPSLQARTIGDDAAPAIAEVARIATRLDPATNPAEPRYLREADAKPQSGFALPHKSA